MPQLFHRSMNIVGKLIILGLPVSVAALGAFLALLFRSDYVTGENVTHLQPVPFSHHHHVGMLGIDCRYCHTTVETSAFAGIPPTKVCMNCHQQIWVGSQMLAPVRESYRTDAPIAWQRVHNLPGFTYFNHSIHIAKGVGCAECHGRVDEMPLTRQTGALLMEWCLRCHRHPETHLRPLDEVFNLTWQASDMVNPDTGAPYDRETLGRRLAREYHIRDTATLISCSTCHR